MVVSYPFPDVGVSQPSPPGVSLKLAVTFIAICMTTIVVEVVCRRRHRCGGSVVVFTATPSHMYHCRRPHPFSMLFLMRCCHHWTPMERRTSCRVDIPMLMRSLCCQRGRHVYVLCTTPSTSDRSIRVVDEGHHALSIIFGHSCYIIHALAACSHIAWRMLAICFLERGRHDEGLVRSLVVILTR